MKIGVEAFITESSIDPAAFAKLAEGLGFESFFLPEHPIIPVVTKSRYPASPDGKMPEGLAHFIDPFIGLALAAAATTRIGLGTGICLVPEHDPINLAKTIATLDHYSGGRFFFGIGAGWLAEESAIMGVDFKRRWPMTREYIRAMKELWTQPEASFAGEFVNFPAVKCYPKPARKPHPPIFIGAGGMGPAMERGLRDTVALGDGWAPLSLPPDELARQLSKLKQMCADAGRDFAKLEITMHVPRLDDEPRRTIDRYQEAGAHRLIFILDSPTPNQYERQLADLAKVWIDHS
ncbi:MAG TPA: LLM class F420-dependent oxidoreductase [Candidatus Binataceae bacterium]|nr:LLM class F420-dependent oxidoreductase [Candidatus Binataceae bacterium]